MSIYENIINSINVEGLSKLEIARLLYIELGKRISFSTRYQNTDEKTMFKMHSDDFDAKNSSVSQANCVMWSKTYSALLAYYGIENRIINKWHQYVEFFIEGQRWVADATYGKYTDLARIHNGDDTTQFGLSMYQKDEEKSSNYPVYDVRIIKLLEEIDEKIGYRNNKYHELEELKKLLAGIKNGSFDVTEYGIDNSVEGKLQFLFAKVGKMSNGFYESKNYLYALEKFMLGSEELKMIHGTDLKRTRLDGEVDIIQIISLLENNIYHYYILCPTMALKEVQSKDISDLALFGYAIEKEIPGIIYPKNFKPGIRPKKWKLKLERIINQGHIKQSNIQEYEKSTFTL